LIFKHYRFTEKITNLSGKFYLYSHHAQKRGVGMRIALIAGRPRIGKKEDNLKKMEEFIKKEDADLYVFGELFLSGYKCGDEFRNLAEPIDE